MLVMFALKAPISNSIAFFQEARHEKDSPQQGREYDSNRSFKNVFCATAPKHI